MAQSAHVAAVALKMKISILCHIIKIYLGNIYEEGLFFCKVDPGQGLLLICLA